MMKKASSVATFSLLAVLVLVGCGRTKELEKQNRDQARAIADLNQQVAGLQGELAGMKSHEGAAPTQGGARTVGSQRSYIK